MADRTQTQTQTDKPRETIAPQDVKAGKPGAPDIRGYNPGVLNAAAQPVDENGSAPMNRQDDPSPDEEQTQTKDKEALLKSQGYKK